MKIERAEGVWVEREPTLAEQTRRLVWRLFEEDGYISWMFRQIPWEERAAAPWRYAPLDAPIHERKLQVEIVDVEMADLTFEERRAVHEWSAHIGPRPHWLVEGEVEVR